MGYSSSWIAVEGADPAQVLQALSLVETGEVRDEWWDPGRCWLRRGAWLVVFCDGSDQEWLTPEQARALSQGRRVLHLEQSDTVMCDVLTGFENGAEVWAVHHDCNRADTPWVTGKAPTPYAAILAECRREQAESGPGVDYLYEVVPLLGKVLVGFRHDEPSADDGFHELE